MLLHHTDSMLLLNDDFDRPTHPLAQQIHSAEPYNLGGFTLPSLMKASGLAASRNIAYTFLLSSSITYMFNDCRIMRANNHATHL